jgi:Lrp/AsnC family transcriptional regulator
VVRKGAVAQRCFCNGGIIGVEGVDKVDRKILALLQGDCNLTAEQIGEKVGLSKAPCWRRIQRLWERGVIKKSVALLDATQLNVKTSVFVMIRTSTHTAEWLQRFSKAMQQLPEITEIHRMSGDVDYLIRVVVPDITAYDAVYKKMISAVDMSDVSASFVLETIKSTTTLPLEYMPLD